MDAISPPVPLLFLIADTGSGHRASATAVAAHMERCFQGHFKIHIVDPFAEHSPRIIGRIADLYGPLVRHAGWLWGALYHATDSRAGLAALQNTALRAVRPGLSALIEVIQPAAVVSFHPLLNHLTAAVLARRMRHIPLLTVITDLNDAHISWACAGADAVVTPSPVIHDRCRRAGVPADRCFDLGLPVDDRFTLPPPEGVERTRLRAELGLDPGRFTVLLAGGGDGSGGLEGKARALAAEGLDVQLVVICGRNRRLQGRLAGLRDHAGRPVVVRGFVSNMSDWLRAADALVTKAGPGSIAEALCCGVPLLLSSFLPGQERGNVDFVVATGCGRYVPGNCALVDTVRELCAPASPALLALRAAVQHHARPEATARISQLIAAQARPAMDWGGGVAVAAGGVGMPS